MIAVTRWSRFP